MTVTRTRPRGRKAGFTLVEIIVTLVILAILAALLIPSLTSYIDKAKVRAIVAETRHAVMAAQTLLSESYGKGRLALERADIKQLSEVPGSISFYEHKNGLLEHLIYNNGEEYCTYCRAASDGSLCPSCGATTLYTVEGRLPDAYVASLMATVPTLKLENKAENAYLLNYFNTGAQNRSIDSTTVNGTNFPKVRKALATAGFDTMSGSWAIIKSNMENGYNYRIYYTSNDIDKMTVGSEVSVTIYDPASGKYYRGQSKIVERELDKKTYNVLSSVQLDKATELEINK